MEDLTFDNDEEKCEGEAQQPHASAPTSHLRGCSRVGLRSSSLPSSDLGSVIVLQSSASTTISIFIVLQGFFGSASFHIPSLTREADTPVEAWPLFFSSGLSPFLAQPLTSCFFIQSTAASVYKALRSHCGLQSCPDLCPSQLELLLFIALASVLLSALNWPLLLY